MAVSEMETIGYEAGYQDGINEAVRVIDNILKHPQIDGAIPTSMTLRIIKTSLLNPEDEDD
jgi:hypothetical protein